MVDIDPDLHPSLPKPPEVILTNWREVLNCAPIPHPLRLGFTRAIEAYLQYCRLNSLSVTRS